MKHEEHGGRRCPCSSCFLFNASRLPALLVVAGLVGGAAVVVREEHYQDHAGDDETADGPEHGVSAESLLWGRELDQLGTGGAGGVVAALVYLAILQDDEAEILAGGGERA